MNTNDRQAIEELFRKLGQAERSGSAAARDPEAEALILEHMTRQTSAAYYMAQTIIVQEHALHAAHERIEDLQRELSSRPATGGGFLSSLFGGGQPRPHHIPRQVKALWRARARDGVQQPFRAQHPARFPVPRGGSAKVTAASFPARPRLRWE